MKFSDLASRQNSTTVKRDWFDALRDSGTRLEEFLGELITKTTFTIVNNQSSPANITGLSFSSITVKAAYVDYLIERVTTAAGATELLEAGMLLIVYRPSSHDWKLTPIGAGPDYAGVDFTVTSGGQVQYVSSSITGTASISRITFKSRSIGV